MQPRLGTLSDGFWVVWSPRGGAPQVRHLTCAAANREAMRLAERFPGRHFYVLGCQHYAMAGEPTLTRTQKARQAYAAQRLTDSTVAGKVGGIEKEGSAE